MIMERKIGEIFEYNGEWLQCVEQPEKYDKTVCAICAFQGNGNCELDRCSGTYRSDKKSVIFKKLEKVGEPYMLEDKKFQKYRVFKTPYIYHKIDCSWQSFADPYYISLEIKEDMEENKLNLKPFDIQKAREGKPVCTRDGRKARIICFDAKRMHQPIIALITQYNGVEYIETYYSNGCFNDDINSQSDYDLMMLPEKKEGWVNVYKGGLLDTKSYPTQKEAFDKACREGYVDTVKICWEE